MKVCHTTDTHLGITGKGVIKNLFKSIAKEDFDLLLHTGDYSGNRSGYGAVKETVEMMREYIPGKPMLTVLGNHDFWCGKDRLEKDFRGNYDKIVKLFKDHSIHFLDEDGVYEQDGITFAGASGWYSNPEPPTNDGNHLPGTLSLDDRSGFISIHYYLVKRSYAIVEQQTKDKFPDVFVSHFPVIDAKNDPLFDVYSWSRSLGEAMFMGGVRYFFNGHAHQHHVGPLRYEPGSDYYQPKYHIIDVIKT